MPHGHISPQWPSAPWGLEFHSWLAFPGIGPLFHSWPVFPEISSPPLEHAKTHQCFDSHGQACLLLHVTDNQLNLICHWNVTIYIWSYLMYPHFILDKESLWSHFFSFLVDFKHWSLLAKCTYLLSPRPGLDLFQSGWCVQCTGSIQTAQSFQYKHREAPAENMWQHSIWPECGRVGVGWETEIRLGGYMKGKLSF